MGLWLVPWYAHRMLFCINGRFVDEKKAMVSVLDHGFLYADGFYDTMRVYDGIVFELAAHLRRIDKTARELQIDLPWGLAAMTHWLMATVSKNRLREARIRVTITRGKKTTCVITCQRLGASKTLRGISACTMLLPRPHPHLKTLGSLSILPSARREAVRKGCDDVIGFDASGRVTEATVANVFLVRGGKIMTPRTGVLPGLTRYRVIALARKIDFTMIIKNFKTSALSHADEIFLTNRVREIIPVTRLNGRKVGEGRVGKVTRKLSEQYRHYVQKYWRSFSTHS